MRMIVLVLGLFVALCGGARASEPFGLLTPPPQSLRKDWENAKRSMDLELFAILQCRDKGFCTPEARRVMEIAEDARQAAKRYGVLALLGLPNRTIRETVHVKLTKEWTPGLSVLQAKEADCKGRTLLLLLILRYLGVPEYDLRAVYVRVPVRILDKEFAAPHLVAAVRMERQWFIVDSRTLTILTDSERAQARGHMKITPFFVLSF